MSQRLPDGLYPFANTRLPLAELRMMEAPAELEALILTAAEENGIELLRDKPVEIRCSALGYPDATFLVFWPTGEAHLNILAPKSAITGRA
ncbi:hypothetical protein [Caulobacter segnis]